MNSFVTLTLILWSDFKTLTVLLHFWEGAFKSTWWVCVEFEVSFSLSMSNWIAVTFIVKVKLNFHYLHCQAQPLWISLFFANVSKHWRVISVLIYMSTNDHYTRERLFEHWPSVSRTNVKNSTLFRRKCWTWKSLFQHAFPSRQIIKKFELLSNRSCPWPNFKLKLSKFVCGYSCIAYNSSVTTTWRETFW